MQASYIRPVRLWLLTGCALVALMVVVGGITRLTRSGLSIVEWNVITGILPPMSEEAWQEEFAKYQTSPEYKLVNAGFTLDDFKGIFWWEFIHRLLGRLIGIVFIIPFVWFLIKKAFDRKTLLLVALIPVLGALQGLIGWIMVKSGLNDMPHVSHFKLALHLITALGIYVYILWLSLKIPSFSDAAITDRSGGSPVHETHSGRSSSFLWIFALVLFVQILYGAFVAGLKAGFMHNTWPLMYGSLIPTNLLSVDFEEYGFIGAFINGPNAVQLIHRLTGILLVLMAVHLILKGMRRNRRPYYTLLGLAVMGQFALGVATLLLRVPVSVGVIHQCGAIAVITLLVIALMRDRETG